MLSCISFQILYKILAPIRSRNSMTRRPNMIPKSEAHQRKIFIGAEYLDNRVR